MWEKKKSRLAKHDLVDDGMMGIVIGVWNANNLHHSMAMARTVFLSQSRLFRLEKCNCFQCLHDHVISITNPWWS